MSVFDRGALQIENGYAGAVLHYHLISRALLFCFLGPPLTSNVSESPDKKDVELQPSPIDKALGALDPEKPKKTARMRRKATALRPRLPMFLRGYLPSFMSWAEFLKPA